MLRILVKLTIIFVNYISYICLTIFFSSLMFLLFWYFNTGILKQHLIDLNNLDFNALVKSLLFLSSIVMLFFEIIKMKIKITIKKKMLTLSSVILFITYSILFFVPFSRTDDLDIQAIIFGFWAISIMFLSIYIGINWALILINLRVKKQSF